MKLNKFLLIMIILLVSVSSGYAIIQDRFTNGLTSETLYFNKTGYCYQEYANISSTCGGLSTGKYSFPIQNIGDDEVYHSTKNVSDGNWDTYSFASCTGGGYPACFDISQTAIMYINYTKPNQFINVTWEVKYGTSTGTTRRNISIPFNCLKQDKLYLEVLSFSTSSAATDEYSKFYCFNGNEYQELSRSNYGCTASSCGYFYEEAVHWINYPNIRYIELPTNIRVLQSNFNLTGIISYGKTNSSCYQEKSNISLSCGAESSGKYSSWFKTNITDGNYHNKDNYDKRIYHINYTKPQGALNTSKYIFTDAFYLTPSYTYNNHSITIHRNCWDWNKTQINFLINTTQVDLNVSCYSSTGWIKIYNSGDPLVSWYVAEEAMNWTIQLNNVTKNPSLEIGNFNNSFEWFYNGYFKNTNISVNNISTTIQNVVNICNCTNCVLSSDKNCTIPLLFESSTKGNILLNNFYINYTTKQSLINCSNGKSNTMLFSFYNESDRNKITANGVIVINYSIVGLGIKQVFIINKTNVYNLSVCLENITNSMNFNLYAQYDKYYTERYYIYDGTITNSSTKYYSLYVVTDATASIDKKTVLDSTYNFLPDITVQMQRYYPEINQWVLVQMYKSDSNGNVYFYVTEETVDYRFVALNRNTVLITTLPSSFVCTSGICTESLYTGVDVNTQYIPSTLGTITYNEDTGVFRYEFNDPSAETSQYFMKVFSQPYTRNVLICEQYAAGSSGIIYCNTSQYMNVDKIAYGYHHSINISEASIYIAAFNNTVNTILNNVHPKEGMTLSSLFLIACLMVGIFSMELGLVMLFLGFLVLGLFGFLNLGTFLFAFAVVIIVVIVYFNKKQQ